MNHRIDAETRAQIAADIARRVHAVYPEAVTTEGPNSHIYPTDVDYLIEVFNVPPEQRSAVRKATLPVIRETIKRLKRFVAVVVLSSAPPEGAKPVETTAEARV